MQGSSPDESGELAHLPPAPYAHAGELVHLPPSPYVHAGELVLAASPSSGADWIVDCHANSLRVHTAGEVPLRLAQSGALTS